MRERMLIIMSTFT